MANLERRHMNTPAVLRESLLPEAFRLGVGAVAASLKLEEDANHRFSQVALRADVVTSL